MQQSIGLMERRAIERMELAVRYREYNALVEWDEAAVFRDARVLDAKAASGVTMGALYGTVISAKDNIEVKGLHATAGMKKYARNIVRRDAPVIERLRAADALILGKTNMPPGAMDMQTDNPVYGRTRHPDDEDYTCGGSSGGGAVAVRLGISDADIGNDFMGSIRVPAHFCGVFGIVGTDNAIPAKGVIGGKPEGVMASMFRIGVQSADLNCARRVHAAASGEKIEVSHNPARLRVAYTTNAAGMPLAREYSEVYTRYLDCLRGGYELIEADSDFDFHGARTCFLHLLYATIALRMPTLLRATVGRGMASYLSRLPELEAKRLTYQATLERLLRGSDALLSPVSATPAFRHIRPHRTMGIQPIYDDIDIDEQTVPYILAHAGYATPFSLTGHPVAVIPIGKAAGLPVGIQVVGQRGNDGRLFALAEQIAYCFGFQYKCR